jgi:hypothetical protein
MFNELEASDDASAVDRRARQLIDTAWPLQHVGILDFFIDSFSLTELHESVVHHPARRHRRKSAVRCEE